MKKFLVTILAALCCAAMAFPGTAMADAIIGGDYNYQNADFWVMVDAPDNYVNLRYGPGTEYAIITPIYNGEYLHVTQTADNRYDGLYWGQTEFEGQYGWISISQTTYVNDPYEVSYDDGNYSEENYGGDGTDDQNYTTDNSGADDQNNTTDNGGTDDQNGQAENEKYDLKVDIDASQLTPDGPWQSQFDSIFDKTIQTIEESTLTAETSDTNEEQYSTKFGAALVADNGNVYTGSLIEISDPELNICAETSALVRAFSAGENSFSMIMVVSNTYGTEKADYYVPCNDCLKRLADFSDPDNFYVVSVTIDDNGQFSSYKMLRLSDLLAEIN